MCFLFKGDQFLGSPDNQGFLYTLRELSNNIINESKWENGFKSEMGELSKKFSCAQSPLHCSQCFGAPECETYHDPVAGSMEEPKHGAEVPA